MSYEEYNNQYLDKNALSSIQKKIKEVEENEELSQKDKLDRVVITKKN